MSKQQHYTDEQIIAALLGAVTERNQLFTYLYTQSGWKEWLFRYVQQAGGDVQGAEDLFQETIILFDRNIREGRFKGASALQTYFLGIGKQYWFNRQRGIKPISMDEWPDIPSIETPETEVIKEERLEIIQDILEKIGEHCRKVLSLFKLSLSNEEIAVELGLKNAAMAKKYTYRCREKFRAYVLEREDIVRFLDIRL